MVDKQMNKLSLEDKPNITNTTNTTIHFKTKNSYKFTDFHILGEIGRGAYSKVYKANHIQDKNTYALKVIERKMIIKKKKLHHCYIECEILSMILEHKNIAKILGAFDHGTKIVLVLEYYPNDDLYEFVKRNSKSYLIII